MKKIMISLIMIVVLITTGCSVIPQNEGDAELPEEPSSEEPAKGAEFDKSTVPHETTTEIDPAQLQSLVEGNTIFALDFYEQIRDQDENIIFSPFSISLALSMAMAGAESTTEEVMLDALRMMLPEDEVYPAFNALLLQIQESEDAVMEEREGTNFELNLANSIWGQVGYDFKEPFLDILARYFDAGMYSVDYVRDPESAREAINDWVEEETENKIQDLIPEGAIDQLTRLVLANAIYFNGSWMVPFDENGTSDEPFYLLDGLEVTVEMMSLFGERFLYADGVGYQAIRLPYLSPDFVMTVIVPDADEFTAFEESLNSEVMNSLRNEMSYVEVNLRMPKFDFETSIDANDALVTLGMGEAFDPEHADFSGITEFEDLMITDVLHKAMITVDEQGTEAAAATAVIVGVTSAMPGEPVSLVIDRPFLFLIEHQPTGTILFMGRVLHP